MRNLINFFIRYSSWLLFVLYTIISLVLIFHSNPYQHHLYLTSANSAVAAAYKAKSSVTSYFNLRDINEDLHRRNADLELEVAALRSALADARGEALSDSLHIAPGLSRYSFIMAHVINNSVNRSHNYLTLNKGSDDGVRPEMGVVDQNGVVGIVNVVGPHASRVISLLNPNLRLSCKVKGHNHVGSLVWQGGDYTRAILEELPRHAVFQPGDTIVTSGYSTVFPEGVPVGTVISGMKDHDENFYALDIRLFTDFATLSTVRIVADSLAAELKEIEADPLEKKR